MGMKSLPAAVSMSGIWASYLPGRRSGSGNPAANGQARLALEDTTSLQLGDVFVNDVPRGARAELWRLMRTSWPPSPDVHNLLCQVRSGLPQCCVLKGALLPWLGRCVLHADVGNWRSGTTAHVMQQSCQRCPGPVCSTGLLWVAGSHRAACRSLHVHCNDATSWHDDAHEVHV